MSANTDIDAACTATLHRVGDYISRSAGQHRRAIGRGFGQARDLAESRARHQIALARSATTHHKSTTMPKPVVATNHQRSTVLRRIDIAEARMLPPGWDAGMHHQFGATLTDPRAQAPLLVDVAQPDPDPEPCAPGLCDPACGGMCRYQTSATGDQFKRNTPKALAFLDEFSPFQDSNPTPTSTQTRALAKWLMAAGIAAGLALVWISSR